MGNYFLTMLPRHFLSSLLVSVGPLIKRAVNQAERGHIPHLSSALFFCLHLTFWHFRLPRVLTTLVPTQWIQNAVVIRVCFWVDSMQNTKNLLSICCELKVTWPKLQFELKPPNPPPRLSSGCCPLGLYWTREEREDRVWPHADSCTLFVSYIRPSPKNNCRSSL